MTVRKFCDAINQEIDCGSPASKVFVQHHLGERLGPIFEAKPMGFGAKTAMVRINSTSWIQVCPLTWTIDIKKI